MVPTGCARRPPHGGFPRFAGAYVEHARLGRLAALVRAGAFPLITLTGRSGVGKSRLAVEVAGRVHERFPGGAVFVDLGQKPDPGVALESVRRALRMDDTCGTWSGLVRRLRARRTLVVADRLDQRADVAAALVEAAALAPGTVVMATCVLPLPEPVVPRFESAG
ncbi:putative Xre family DNA-binding protein [Kineosphaera limosa NBRC 100340]|uniref:Putative Xre family DNA-binding protein n=2 Tax=Kineosphaera TaxID=211469 RepID=K6VMR8_9MICO|nr:putative Xre family DNA-binding protein [Kineosphaera limosa NBRC 100340]